MRVIRNILKVGLLGIPISFAGTLDFDGENPSFAITGNSVVGTSSICGGDISVAPRSGCKALLIAIDPYRPPNVPRDQAITTVFDIPSGFNQLSFFYATEPDPQIKVEIYDGSGGTGNVLKTDLPGPAICFQGGGLRFCDWATKVITIFGVARSAKITARDERVMIDDLAFGFATEDIIFNSHTTPPRGCAASLRTGNPIEPLTGRKIQNIDLGVSLAGIPLTLNYDSIRANRPIVQSGRLPSFGGGWTGSWLKSIVSLTPTPESSQPPFGSFRPDGREETFIIAQPNVTPVAWKAVSGDVDNLQFVDAANINYKAIHEGLVERNTSTNGAWRPTKFALIAGTAMGVITSDTSHPLVLGGVPVVGLPVQLYDDFGRKVTFQYRVVPRGGEPYINAKVVGMTLPDGSSIKFDYSYSGNLTSITWPDASVTTLDYDDPSSANRLWTGVIDEAGKRFSTFTYDGSGRAIATEHAGGVDSHSVSYSTPPDLVFDRSLDAASQRWIYRYHFTAPTGAVLTNPNGSVSQVGVTQAAGYNAPTSFSQPAGSGCAASTSTQEFDAKGNLAWKEDFKQNRTCYANDLDRNLETSRVEGLASGSACASVLTANATLPSSARKVSTTWHPVWRKQVQVAEPRRLTTNVYNGQPDPFNGNAVASCAPSDATLPDGSPIVVLCKQVEQATSDANGAQGFSAPVDATVPARVQQWTYNQFGQVLTAKDPLNNTTTNTYYADTTADHTMGDLATVTNALNQVTRYTKYNPVGQWLEMVDANSIATTRTFDLRQRLKSTTTTGLTTSYDYWPTGLLKTVTLPEASSVSYGYDDAQRLTSVTDNLGNKITYTLDNSGNRIGENVTDPTGRLAKTLTRVPDALNRIQQISGRE